jgi:hypothetical protein
MIQMNYYTTTTTEVRWRKPALFAVSCDLNKGNKYIEDTLESNGDSLERIIHSRMTRYLPNPRHCETADEVVWRRDT